MGPNCADDARVQASALHVRPAHHQHHWGGIGEAFLLVGVSRRDRKGLKLLNYHLKPGGEGAGRGLNI